MSVMVVTSVGELVIDLFTDHCPLTTKNFLKLCKIKYFNGCLFHTIQKDFTAQTGDPSGTATAGDSIYRFLYGDQARFFADEIHQDLKHSKIGTVAMASAGENLNASQFYITLRDDLDYLDGKHTVFGEVVEGLDTLTRINEAYVDEKGRPYKNIRIKHTYILHDPFDDPSQLKELIPDASPEGKPKEEVDDDVRLEDDWVPIDEQLGLAEREEMLHAKAAHSSAVVLESIGDIPDAEMKPPDNVLFVCKLNPVTEDEDLNTIFSRFGNVTSAEVIRDFKTGDSLCYAFIEFETNEACEQAYFKMDNALIDDRRIHVDFSQSVAKLWSQYRRKGNHTGSGCFKCGSSDHMAKDCTGGAGTSGMQAPKYVLKEENAQRGGDDKSRYDMVFDDDDNDDDDTPVPDKRRREHESDYRGRRQQEKKQDSDDVKYKDRGRRDNGREADRHHDKSRERRDDERFRHEERKNGSRGGDKRDGHRNGERLNRDDYRREDKYDRDRRDERGYKKSDRHREMSQEPRSEELDSRKRNADGRRHGDEKRR
ncbi:hypothetical protein Scep_027213 [Stephania cephalantha]|uniref:Peptidyl-prolyl cis-trans isomerase n=1 Tax=Stephania cephalantha TaxID=152367 RepID=A0AAP0E7K7_9MAGN